MDKRKKLLIGIGTAFATVIAGIVIIFTMNSYLYVSTEDARVTADIVRINSQMSGKLVSSELEEGMTVHKDQILARIETANIPDQSIEQTLLRAPIDGVIIKKQGTVGEITSAGQTLGMVVDPDQLYVSANIEETDLNKLKIGQVVDVKIDQYKGAKWKGTLTSIGEATNSTFSLLSSSGSTFTKVVQKVPVRIALNSDTVKLRPGTNATVKIHIH